MTKVDEQISVGVVFKHGSVAPKWLSWKGRVIHISSIPLRYDGRDGATPLTYFSLASETSVYGVVWNRKTNIWKLIEVNQ